MAFVYGDNDLLSHTFRDEEIKRRIEELDSGKAKTVPWEDVRERNLRKLARWH